MRRLSIWLHKIEKLLIISFSGMREDLKNSELSDMHGAAAASADFSAARKTLCG
jgi:hypothetical protein